MNLPRDISGVELARLLERYDYQIIRQTGSHIRLTSTIKDTQHHITIPGHKSLKVDTVSKILNDVASYLELDRKILVENLFKDD